MPGPCAIPSAHRQSPRHPDALMTPHPGVCISQQPPGASIAGTCGCGHPLSGQRLCSTAEERKPKVGGALLGLQTERGPNPVSNPRHSPPRPWPVCEPLCSCLPPRPRYFSTELLRFPNSSPLRCQVVSKFPLSPQTGGNETTEIHVPIVLEVKV